MHSPDIIRRAMLAEIWPVCVSFLGLVLFCAGCYLLGILIGREQASEKLIEANATLRAKVH